MEHIQRRPTRYRDFSACGIRPFYYHDILDAHLPLSTVVGWYPSCYFSFAQVGGVYLQDGEDYRFFGGWALSGLLSLFALYLATMHYVPVPIRRRILKPSSLCNLGNLGMTRSAKKPEACQHVCWFCLFPTVSYHTIYIFPISRYDETTTISIYSLLVEPLVDQYRPKILDLCIHHRHHIYDV
ncbi:hypothetical protein BJ912DRAFT_511663 [Pholiota molesta]|nr:hypothetical protein BJ912DRAFT_511663 [Pholiota molesta]